MAQTSQQLTAFYEHKRWVHLQTFLCQICAKLRSKQIKTNTNKQDQIKTGIL